MKVGPSNVRRRCRWSRSRVLDEVDLRCVDAAWGRLAMAECHVSGTSTEVVSKEDKSGDQTMELVSLYLIA